MLDVLNIYKKCLHHGGTWTLIMGIFGSQQLKYFLSISQGNQNTQSTILGFLWCCVESLYAMEAFGCLPIVFYDHITYSKHEAFEGLLKHNSPFM